jgi:hypothetical protein
VLSIRKTFKNPPHITKFVMDRRKLPVRGTQLEVLSHLRHVDGNIHGVAGGLDALHGCAVRHQLLSLPAVPV